MLSEVVSLLAIIGGSHSLFQLYNQYAKPKPKFKINQGSHVSWEPFGVSLNILLSNAGKASAHNLKCLISAIESGSGEDVVRHPIIFNEKILVAGSNKRKEVGAHVAFKPNKEYTMRYVVVCDGMDPWEDSSKLSTLKPSF